MEKIYKIAVILFFTIVSLYLFKHYLNDSEPVEGFENGNNNGENNGNENANVNGGNNVNGNNINSNNANGLSLNNIVDGASEGVNASENNNNNSNNNSNNDVPECKPGNWWENGPIKAIRSKLWGASYNLIYDENGNINTPVSVPINNPNSQSPPGCLTVSESGWHETATCVENDVKQRWKILKIGTQEEFQAAIDAGKENGGTVGFTYGYKLDKFDYPFFLVVSSEYPSQALYYNGSALGVRPIGNYDDQKWDILPSPVQEPVTTTDFNFYSKLTPELRTSQSSLASGMQGAGLSGGQSLGNQKAMAELLSNILKKPNTNGEFGVTDGLKVNIEMDNAVISQITGDAVAANNTPANNASANTTVVESFVNHVPTYPKKSMDIEVTLNYSTAQAPKPSQQAAPGVTKVPIQQIDSQGKMVTLGNVDVDMIGEDGRTLCDDSLCHPDMRDWASKPYPCRGCVPGEETW